MPDKLEGKVGNLLGGVLAGTHNVRPLATLVQSWHLVTGLLRTIQYGTPAWKRHIKQYNHEPHQHECYMSGIIVTIATHLSGSLCFTHNQNRSKVECKKVSISEYRNKIHFELVANYFTAIKTKQIRRMLMLNPNPIQTGNFLNNSIS